MAPFGRRCRRVARLRMEAGFSVEEVGAAIENFGECCTEILKAEMESEKFAGLLDERIRIAVQFGIDEIRDEFELAGLCC